MKRLFLILISIFFLTGCSSSPLPSADENFDSFTNQIFCESVASSTLGLHYTLQNPSAYDIRHDTISFGKFETDFSKEQASLENLKCALQQFPYDKLSKENKLTYDILSNYIDISLIGTSFFLYEEPLAPVTGLHVQLPILLAEYPLLSKEDVNTYLSLLSTLPKYFSSLIAFEKEKSAAGLFMDEHALSTVLSQCEDFVSMGESNYLVSSFDERISLLPSLSIEEINSFRNKNVSLLKSVIYPSYQFLIDELSSISSPKSHSINHSYYEYLVKKETGSLRSISELESLISQQLAKDQSFLLNTRATPDQMPTLSPEQILDSLKSESQHAFPMGPDIHCEIKDVPPSLREHSSPAFYLIPPLDNYTENVIYINPSHNQDETILFTTLAHEGYPGHLYQTTFFAHTNPSPIRHILSFDGYVEGWATYAEMCSYSLLPLESNFARLLQKNSSLILGLYAAADIGINYHGWRQSDTVSFFASYGIDCKETVQSAHDYIKTCPTNYLKYYVGYLEILELKKKAIDHYGDDFSQKAFHRKLLEIGPAPFHIIEKYLFS